MSFTVRVTLQKMSMLCFSFFFFLFFFIIYYCCHVLFIFNLGLFFCECDFMYECVVNAHLFLHVRTSGRVYEVQKVPVFYTS